MSKGMVYAITFVVCLFLQVGVAPAIQIGECAPNFLLIPVLLVALKSGVGFGSLAGFFCGLFEDFAGNETIGCMALTMTLVAIIVGAVGSVLEVHSPLITCVVVVCACLLVMLGYGLAVVLSNPESPGALAVVTGYSLPSAVYTAVFGCFALVTMNMVLADDTPSMNQLGGRLGGNPGNFPRMKSRLK